MRTILLDLDDTLVPDHSDFLAAVDETAAALGAPAEMSAAVRARAQQRWREAAAETTLRMTDISSWESLWAPFPADLRSWAHGHRLGVWREALRDCGVDDVGLARRLAESYRERRLALAMDLLSELTLAELITHRFPFARAAEAYALLDTDASQTVQVVLDYA